MAANQSLDVVEEIGVEDPDFLLAKPVRHSRVDIEPPRRRNRASAPGTDSTPIAPLVPDWVAAARAWTPADLDTVPTEVAWVVQGLVPQGKVGALVAAGGTGKTTLLLTMFACIALGRPFLGRDTAMGTCVLLSADDPQEDLEAALALVCKSMQLSKLDREHVAWKVRVISLQGFAGTKTFTRTAGGSIEPTGLDAFIVQALVGITDLVCVAIDTLRQFAGGSSNDEQVIKLVVEGCTSVAAALDCTVVLPHHTGKQNYRDGIADMYSGTGSAALGDNCRFVLVLQSTTWPDIEGQVARTGQERGDPLVLTPSRGSLLCKAGDPVFLHRDGFYLGHVAGVVLTRDAQEDKKDRAILAAVQRGAQTKNAIAAAVRGNRTRALARVDDLEGRGLLQRSGSESGSGKLMLSSAGARFMEAAE
jgi:RecA-family ATPase